MSRAQGFLPVLLAVAFGVGNGIYVFYPSIKEEKEEKEGKLKKSFEEEHADSAALAALKEAVANAEHKKEAQVEGFTQKQRPQVPAVSAVDETKPEFASSKGSWFSKFNVWPETRPKPDLKKDETPNSSSK